MASKWRENGVKWREMARKRWRGALAGLRPDSRGTFAACAQTD